MIKNNKLFSFHGGVKIESEQLIKIDNPIKNIAIPPKLYLPLIQHVGKQSIPVVNIGDKVLKGQLIADLEGFISARIHAPTSGVIESIGEYPIPHPSNIAAECIVIRTDGEDKWLDHRGAHAPESLHVDDIKIFVENAGIVGLGGATFPLAVKLNKPPEVIIDTLIINGVECEPYISCDDALMRERAEEVVLGARLIQKSLSAKACIIAIEADMLAAYESISKATENYQNEHMKVVVIPEVYPAGSEKQLIKVLTNKEVPAGKIPAQIGITSMNVGTATAVYRAVYLGEPLISRIITLTGGALKKPGNFETLFGTPMHHLLKEAELDTKNLDRFIMGGPMMGVNLSSLNVPVTKATNCLLATNHGELYEPSPAMPCIRCGRCAESCPMSLLPQQLYWYSKARDLDRVQEHNLFDCIECGCCAYVCPSNISLVQYYRFAKSEIRAEREKQKKADLAKQRFEFKEKRIERINAEKAAKRKHMQARKKAMEAKAASKDAVDGEPASQEDDLIKQAMLRVQAKKQNSSEKESASKENNEIKKEDK